MKKNNIVKEVLSSAVDKFNTLLKSITDNSLNSFSNLGNPVETPTDDNSILTVNKDKTNKWVPYPSGTNTTVSAGSDITVKKTNDDYEVSVSEEFKLEVDGIGATATAAATAAATNKTDIATDKSNSFANLSNKISVPIKDTQLLVINKDGTNAWIDVPSGGGGDASEWSKFNATQNVNLANNDIVNLNRISHWKDNKFSGFDFRDDGIYVLDSVLTNEAVYIVDFIKAHSNPKYVAPAFGGVLSNRFVQGGSAYAKVDNNFYDLFKNVVIPNDTDTTAVYNSITNYSEFEKVFDINAQKPNNSNGYILNNNNKIFLIFYYQQSALGNDTYREVKLPADSIIFYGGSSIGTQMTFKWRSALTYKPQSQTNLPIPSGIPKDYEFILWLPQNSNQAQLSLWNIDSSTIPPVAVSFINDEGFKTAVFKIGFVITSNNNT